MPAQLYTGQDAEDVAEYVAKAAAFRQLSIKPQRPALDLKKHERAGACARYDPGRIR